MNIFLCLSENYELNECLKIVLFRFNDENGCQNVLPRYKMWYKKILQQNNFDFFLSLENVLFL